MDSGTTGRLTGQPAALRAMSNKCQDHEDQREERTGVPELGPALNRERPCPLRCHDHLDSARSRGGLAPEVSVVPVGVKAELISRLIGAGLGVVEPTSSWIR